MPEHWVIVLAIGLAAGVLSGLFGIGGGVIIVPALAIFAGFTTVEAISTSLAALLLPVGAFAVVVYYRAKLLDMRSAALIAFGLITTTWLGAEITLSLPADTLKQAYGVFLLYVSWRFIEPIAVYNAYQARSEKTDHPESAVADDEASDESDEETAVAPGFADPPAVPWYVILIVGLVAGIASGMFGIGGGAVIVPALVAILKYDQKLASGTSLGALLLPVGLPGVLRYSSEGVLDYGAAALVAFGLLVGALFGAKIALGLPSRTVKQMYGAFLVFVAVRFIAGV